MNLIRNEWMKLWARKGTWVMLVLSLVITIGLLSITKWTGGNLEGETEDWKATTKQELKEVKEGLAVTTISDPQRDRLISKEKVLQYRLDQSIQPIDGYSQEAIIMNPSSIAPIILLLTVIVSAGIVASEFSQGTIKMLLTRPVKRWKILMSKFITVNLFCLALLLINYLIFIAFSFILFKSSGGHYLIWSGGQVVEQSIWARGLYMLLLSFGSIFITSTFAFTIGTVFRSSSMAIGLSIFIYFTGSTIVMLLSKYEITKYILFTHMDLTQFESGYMIFEDITMPFSLAVLSIYLILFLAISYLTFSKRDIKA